MAVPVIDETKSSPKGIGPGNVLPVSRETLTVRIDESRLSTTLSSAVSRHFVCGSNAKRCICLWLVYSANRENGPSRPICVLSDCRINQNLQSHHRQWFGNSRAEQVEEAVAGCEGGHQQKVRGSRPIILHRHHHPSGVPVHPQTCHTRHRRDRHDAYHKAG